VYVGAGAAIAVAAAIAWWFHRSLTAASRPTATAGFLNTFSAERYRPMGLLLDEGEFRFLAGLPGYSKDLGRRFRRERVRIFRGYFARLKRDFHRLHEASRLALVLASGDQAGLAGVLLRQRWAFTCACFAVEWRLLRYQAGLAAMECPQVVEMLEDMRAQLATMALPAPAASEAAAR
jgi:hypothetical protein